MREHNGKRAVIISNIKSNSIEQAIFILRPQPAEISNTEVSGGIVAEAQEIINSYINKIENRKHGNTRKINRFLAIICASAFAVTAAAIVAILML